MVLFVGLGLGIIYFILVSYLYYYYSFKRSRPGHHLLAKTGLHYSVLWQEEALGHRSLNINTHAEFSTQYHKKIERLSAKVLQICLRHRHLWLWNRNLHLCPTYWLVIVILISSIHHPDVTINSHHDHYQAADHVLLANSAADLGRDLHGQLRLRPLLQAHPRMQGRANNNQIMKQIMTKFWPIDSQFYYHDVHRILRLRLARLCCL